jgi:NAD(P)-dependent dehydrogenase (short-subunit alcohol dehydrogenase family)
MWSNDLSDTNIFLSGAGGHLGSSLALGLADAGAWVHLNGRSEASLQKVHDEILERGGKASIHCFDICDSQQLVSAKDELQSKYGMLHGIINNAYHGGSGSLENSTEDDYNQAYKVSVTAAASVIRTFLPLLRQGVKKKPGGVSVINVSSMYAMVSPDPRLYNGKVSLNPAYYGAAKAALLQLTRQLAVELALEGIRVNAICPGPFPKSELEASDPQFLERLRSRVPMGRLGTPEEMIGPVVFLSSKASSYMTGSHLTVDGGWTAW